MRVGRISAVNFVPYRDVRNLMRYYSLKSVAMSSLGKDRFAQINTLQPYDNKNLKQQTKSIMAANDMMIDTLQENTVENATTLREKINAIKNFGQARKGSDISAMKQMMDSQVTVSMLSRSTIEKIYDNLEKMEENQNRRGLDREKGGVFSADDKKEPSLIEEYAEQLEKIQKSKEEKKIREAKEDEKLSKEKKLEEKKRQEKNKVEQEKNKDDDKLLGSKY